MPILNLSKLKKEESKEANKDVPDELPSLPAEEKKEDKVAEKNEGLAPDELPPIKEGEPAQEVQESPDQPDASQQAQPVHPFAQLTPTAQQASSDQIQQESKQVSVKKVNGPVITDERLYFSRLIRKLNEGKGIDEIENEIKSEDIISRLNKNVDINKKRNDSSAIEAEIKVMIADLQSLEKEWSTLKIEIDEKTKQFEEVEKKIRENTENIKKKFSEIEELKKQIP